MSTKFDLEFPYNEDWKFGYLVTNRENRRNVILYNSSSDRSTVAYARYLLSVNIGRYLTGEEQADHIDNDKTNDAISNLQILSPEDNLKKSVIKYGGAKYVNCSCPNCHSRFYRRFGNTNLVPSRSGGVMYCSRACQHLFRKRAAAMDSDLLKLISEEQIICVVKVLPSVD